MRAKVHDKFVDMLIDTGSNLTILQKKLFDGWSTFDPKIEPVNLKMITATGEISPFLGKVKVNLSLGRNTTEHEVLLADIQNEGIIGLDLMNQMHCDVLLSKNCLKIGGEIVPCFRKQDIVTCCRIAIKDDVVVPAESEMVLSGKLMSRVKGAIGVVEGQNNFMERSGLMIARSVVDQKDGVIPLRVVNFGLEPIAVFKNTIAATYDSLPSLQPPSEIMWSQKNQEICPPHLEKVFQESRKNLTEGEQNKLKTFLIKHQDVFSKTENDLGCTHLVQHQINTGSAKPIRQQPYRVPIAKRQAAEAEIKTMAEKGVIEPSKSPWCSPIVMVTKPNGDIRFCCDFRKLNDVTVKDSQPLPRIDDTLDALSGSLYFSVLDCKSGFWQVSMAEKDREKTAFSVQGCGLWQFKVMPFGLCNAPATFERLMERILHGLTWQICLVYLDDIIVYANTFDEHLERLDQVLTRINGANLKLSPEKCKLFQKKVNFLGHTISETGIATDEKKIQAIVEWPTPKTVREIRSFLGLCSYYRRFVQNFSCIAKPLHKLTEKDKQFQWDSDCQHSFELLKKHLSTSPILSFPTSSGQFVLDTDASGVGVGAVISQLQNDKEKVIAYYSKCLSKPEKHYCVTRRELLAVISAIKFFHHYLFGRHFIVRSDHGALRWITNFKKPEGQIARWLEFLSQYDFEIQFRPGRVHSNADALSRRPCLGQGCSFCSNLENRYGANSELKEMPDKKPETFSEGNEESNAEAKTSLPSECSGGTAAIAGHVRDAVLSGDWGCVKACDRKCGGETAASLNCVSAAVQSNRLASSSYHDVKRNDENLGTTAAIAGHIRDAVLEPTFLKSSISGVQNQSQQAMESDSLGETAAIAGHVRDAVPATLKTTPVDPKYCNLTSVEQPALLIDYTVTAPKSTGRVINGHVGDRLCRSQVMDSSQQIGAQEIENNDPVHYTEPVLNIDSIGEQCSAENTGNFTHEMLVDSQKQDQVLFKLRDWKVRGIKPNWATVAPESSELKYLWSRFDSLQIRDDLLCHEWHGSSSTETCWQILLPQTIRFLILKELHATPTGGHLGAKKTLGKVRRRFFWVNMRKDTELFCQSCEICASRTGPRRHARAKMKQYLVGAPLERVGIDIMGPFPRSDVDNKYILVIVDYFTKWITAVPLPNQEAETVATSVLNSFLAIFGVPKQIHTDQGTNFQSALFCEMCSLLGIDKTRATAFHPQSDGLVERGNRTIQNMLAKFVSENHRDWDKFLSLVTLAYNSSVQESTGYSPSLLMFGREVNLPLDLVLGNPNQRECPGISSYVSELQSKVETVHEMARKRLKFSSDIQKRKYDVKAFASTYQPGDKVWLYTPTVRPGLSRKLTRFWTGPYVILERINDVVYRVQRNPRCKEKYVHHDRLKPFRGTL